MDAQTCIQKLRLICNVTMATVDENGTPQARTINVMHVDGEKLYFLTARGKPFHKELTSTGKVCVVALSKYSEMIRLNGTPHLVPAGEQEHWRNLIFKENPVLNNVYPGDTRRILDIFTIDSGEIEYFHLGVHPIFRESYSIGDGAITAKGYQITDDCIACGKCAHNCPQSCIQPGTPYSIEQSHCLHCGLCAEVCPVGALEEWRDSL